MQEPDLVDQRLNFGSMEFGQGHAFPFGDADPLGDSTVATGKSFERIEGRLFLIEKVDYASVSQHLGNLPQAAAIKKGPKAGPPGPGRQMMAKLLPEQPLGERGVWPKGQYAKADTNRKGYVLDYVALATASLTNYLFKSDTTYNITGTVNLYGTTVIEGLAVLKYTSVGRVRILGPLDCRTAAYHPLILTGKDDDKIGEIISGSTGSPGNAYGSPEMISLEGTNSTYELHDLQISHANRGITLTSKVQANISNFQVVNGGTAFGLNGGSTVTSRNFLFYKLSQGAVTSGTPTNRAEHATMHRLTNFRAISSTNGLFTLTNCLLISVTNQLLYEGANVVTSLDETGFFQTVGSGAHYLAAGSTNRNAGTTNINSDLLASLRNRTTYPPIVLTNHITGDTTLTVQAQRDTDTPDLGYLYDPLDFVASQIAVTNATLTLQAGTALGLFGASNAPGILLLDGGKLISEGTPDNLNRITRYNLVQEELTNSSWSASSVGPSMTTPGTYATNLLPTEATFRFTDWSMPASGNVHFYAGATNLTLSFQDCQFSGGQFTAVQPDVDVINSLFNRVSVTLAANANPFTALVRNCTFFDGAVTVQNNAAGAWTFTDNLFDTTNIVHVGVIAHNFNAYLTNSARLTNNGANDVPLTLAGITYDPGALGRFYLPTNLTNHSPLFNSGSQNATNAGLYHFTITTNQVKEATSTVDVGFHYVAVNASGQPIDTDGDGLADYFEDTDGDGIPDTGETGWGDYNSLNRLGGSPGLEVFTPLK
jgi:hypothetical protein